MRDGLQGALAAMIVLGFSAAVANAQLMIVGNDQKPGWDKDMKAVLQPAGHDSLSIIDTSKPDALKMIATIPLDNSIVGPPTNLAITPRGDLALVANTVNGIEKEGKWATVTDDRLFVIDLKASPPAVTATLHLGKRPSGLAISADGKLALVCNREDGTVSVLAIDGKEVKITDTVTVGVTADAVAAVAITPDGKRALVAKAAANKIAILAIDNGKVTYGKHDLPGGIFPYNVVIAPNGKLALTANTGNGGSSDGNLDTVSVIDLEADPPRVVDHVTVGDSPEGLVMSPRGDLVVTVEARGSNYPKGTWFHNDTGAVTVLKIDGKKVTRIGAVPVGTFPEGGAFSADGGYLYVGNFIDQDLSVLKLEGDKLSDTGKRFKLPGQPASMRSGPQ